MYRLNLMFTIPLCLFFGKTAFTQVPDSGRWNYMRTITPEGYVCYRASGAIELDGSLNDAAWGAVPWTNYFVDIEGERKPLPRFKTRVKMLWDGYFLYIGAEMEEPHVWGTLGYRDQVMFYENDFEMFIDPNGDNQEYYELEMSPLAAVWDMFLPTAYRDMTKGISPNAAWDIPGIRCRVRVDGTFNDPRDTDRGWFLEMAIPWSGLAAKAHTPCPPRHGDTWRVNFSRVEYICDTVTSDRVSEGVRNNAYKTREGIPCDNWVWSPQGVVNMHCPEMWGYLQFSTAQPGTDSYCPDPTLEARRILHEIYYAQRDYRAKNKRWAGSLKELGVDFSGYSASVNVADMESTAEGWIIRLTATLPDGKTKKVSIRQDSKVEEE
jgi:hypothetical protein